MSDSLQLKLGYRTRAFVQTVRSGTCGVAGENCWCVSDGNVITWNPQTGTWSQRWEAAVGADQVIGSALSSKASSSPRSKRKKPEPDEDGLILATQTSVFFKYPSSLGMTSSRSFSIDDFNFDESESLTSLDGYLELESNRIVCWIGTAHGKIYEVTVPISDAPSSVLRFNSQQNAGFLASVFTPRRRWNKSEAVIAIKQRNRSAGAALRKNGSVVSIDSSAITHHSEALTEQQAMDICVSQDDKVYILSTNSIFQVIEDQSASELLSLRLMRTFRVEGSPRRLVSAGKEFIMTVERDNAELRLFTVSLEKNTEITPLEPIPLSAGEIALEISAHDNDLIVLTSNGFALSNKRLGQSAALMQGKAMSQEKVERLTKSVVSMISGIILDRSLFSSPDYTKDVGEVMRLIDASDDFAELRNCDVASRKLAQRCFYQLARSKLCRPSGRGAASLFEEKLGLLLVLLLGVAKELKMEFTSDEEGEKPLQFMGEALFGAAESVSANGKEVDCLIDRSALLNNYEEVEGLADIISSTNLTEEALLVSESLVRGAQAFVELVQGRSSVLLASIKPQIVSCMKAAAMSQKQRPASDRVKRLFSLSRSLLDIFNDDHHLLTPLMSIVRNKNESPAMRDLTTVAAKQLSEEYCLFDSLLELCLGDDTKTDLVLVETCLRRHDGKWDQFPLKLFQWLIDKKKIRDAFRLASDPTLKTQFVSALAEKKQNTSEALWLAYVEMDDWTNAAEIATGPLALLSGFVAGEDEFRKNVRRAIHHGGQDLVDILLLELGLCKGVPRDKDFIWAHAVLADVPIWKQVLEEQVDQKVIAETVFVRLAQMVRRRKQDKLLPGPDFFENLKENLGRRVQSTTTVIDPENFAAPQMGSLGRVLHSYVFS